MALLFHRTLVSLASAIVKEGFGDEEWGFGEDNDSGRALTATGVWLTDRPVDPDDGPPGAAVLEVDLSMTDEELVPFEIYGVLNDARLFVIPATVVNPRATVRIGRVDARSSWFHEQVDEEVDEEGT